MTHLKLQFINPADPLSSAKEVSAVFLIALKDGKIVAIRNHRGWDIPAGHVEEGETIMEALIREVHEEASMDFNDAIPFVRVSNDDREGKYAGKCMIGFVTSDFTLNEFIPAPDSEERKLMKTEEFVALYQGQQEDMERMIEKAQSFCIQN